MFCHFREMFDTENEAARAYDTALWRLKPREARNYANLKDTCPPDVAEMLATLEKVRNCCYDNFTSPFACWEAQE